jgi:hypothetical protein
MQRGEESSRVQRKQSAATAGAKQRKKQIGNRFCVQGREPACSVDTNLRVATGIPAPQLVLAPAKPMLLKFFPSVVASIISL